MYSYVWYVRLVACRICIYINANIDRNPAT